MKTVNVADLVATALDWAVAQCEAKSNIVDYELIFCADNNYMGFYDFDDVFSAWKPSSDWVFGGGNY